MSNQDIDQDEKPLDPATERVRKKMVRLLGVSIGLMMIGLMAVLGAIIYKFSTSGKKDQAVVSQTKTITAPGAFSSEMVEQSLDIPNDAKILETSLNGSQVLLRLMIDGGQQLWIFDVISGEAIAKITVK